MLIQSIGGTDCTTAAGACAVAVTSLTDPSRILVGVTAAVTVLAAVIFVVVIRRRAASGQ